MLTRKQLLKRTLTYHEADSQLPEDKRSDNAGPGFFQYVVTAFSSAGGNSPSSSSSEVIGEEVNTPPLEAQKSLEFSEAKDQYLHQESTQIEEDDVSGYDYNQGTSSSSSVSLDDSSDSDDSDDDGVVMIGSDRENVEVTILQEDIGCLQGNKENEEKAGGMTEQSEFSRSEKNILSGRKDGNGSKQLRSAMSMADLRNAYQERKKRTMRFSSTVHVCLVPTREEMRCIFDELYFRAEDFQIFKREAVMELREVLTRLGITSKQAIKLMYQPNPDEEAIPLRPAPSRTDYNTIQEGPSLSDDEETDDMSGKRRTKDHKDKKIRRIDEEMDADTDHDSGDDDAKQQRSMSSANTVSPTTNRDLVCDNAKVLTAIESTFDEGPSLSDDEEESRKYEESVNSKLMSSAPFLTGAKTDVELNMSNIQSSDKINLPSKTPSGGGGGRSPSGEKEQMWEVAWKKKNPDKRNNTTA